MKRRARLCGLTLVAGLVLAIAAPAYATPFLYAGTGSAGIFLVDTVTGNADTKLSNLNATALAFDDSGELFASHGGQTYRVDAVTGEFEVMNYIPAVTLAVNSNGELFAGTGSRIYRIDTATGDFSVLNEIDAQALVFDSNDQLLAGTGSAGIFLVDTVTGNADTKLSNLNATALAFDDSGELFASHGGQTYRVDAVTGEFEVMNYIPAVTLAFANGELFAGTGADIYRIDTVTGDFSVHSPVDAQALAWLIPEPSTAVLVACGLVGVGLSRTRTA